MNQFKSFKVIEDGERVDLPRESLGDYRDVTFTELERRKTIVEILKLKLNELLGFCRDEEELAAHQSRVFPRRWNSDFTENRVDYDQVTDEMIEETLQIAHIKFTPTGKFANGEKNRIFERMKNVPMLDQIRNNSYWNNSRKYYNEDLINPRTDSGREMKLEHFINKFKIRTSRNNRYSATYHKIDDRMYNFNSDNWHNITQTYNRLVNDYRNRQPQRNPTRGPESRAYDMVDFNLLWCRGDRNLPVETEEGRQFVSKRNSIEMIAEILELLKSSLKFLRDCPAIESDDEDYSEFREWLLWHQTAIIDANHALRRSEVRITNTVITKENGRLYIYNKYKFKEMNAFISHPSSDGDVYIRKFVDLDNETYGFNVITKSALNQAGNNFTTSTFGASTNICGYSDSRHNYVNFYNTSTITARMIRGFDYLFGNGPTQGATLPNNCCFGGHDIPRIVATLSPLTIATALKNWLSMYTPGMTSPYAHPNSIFYGVPRDIPSWYKPLHDASGLACKNNLVNRYSHASITLNHTEDHEDDKYTGLDHMSKGILHKLLENKCNSCLLVDNCYFNDFAKEYAEENVDIHILQGYISSHNSSRVFDRGYRRDNHVITGFPVESNAENQDVQSISETSSSRIAEDTSEISEVFEDEYMDENPLENSLGATLESIAHRMSRCIHGGRFGSCSACEANICRHGESNISCDICNEEQDELSDAELEAEAQAAVPNETEEHRIEFENERVREINADLTF